jgi:monovalent cation/hydrogen antiporter
VELLATGLAFGLMGLEIRKVVVEEGAAVFGMLGLAVTVCVLVIAVRFLWMAGLAWLSRGKDGALPPTSTKDVLILTWCGMRGLATLALALAIPVTLPDGTAFAGRHEILVVACAVLLATLVLPGLTLPWLMRVLKAQDGGTEEHEAARVLAGRAQEAAIAALHDSELLKDLPAEKVEAVKQRMHRLGSDLLHAAGSKQPKSRKAGREVLVTAQTIALNAARQEVVAARSEPDMDPEVVDRVLRQLDLRTISIR